MRFDVGYTKSISCPYRPLFVEKKINIRTLFVLIIFLDFYLFFSEMAENEHFAMIVMTAEVN